MAFRPLVTAKTVRGTLKSAENLCKKDIFGASDPYVQVYREMVGSYDLENPTNVVWRSKTQKRTLEPEWMEAFEVVVDPTKHILIADVFDENRLTRDDFLGRVTINLETLSTVENVFVKRKLKQRSKRSNVTGYLIMSAHFSGESDSLDIVANQTWWFYENLESYSLEPQVDILTEGQWRDPAYNVTVLTPSTSTRSHSFTFNPDRGELTIPVSATKTEQKKKILNFFFGVDTIGGGDRSSDWNAVQMMVAERADLRYAERLRRKIFGGELVRPSSLQEVELKVWAWARGQRWPRYVAEYRTLIVPYYRKPVDLLHILVEWVNSGEEEGPEEEVRENTEEEDQPEVEEHTEELSPTLQGCLPPGWEERSDNNGRVFYVNHNTRSTSFERPVAVREAEVALAEAEETLASISSITSTGERFQARRNISLEDDDLWSGRESSTTTSPEPGSRTSIPSRYLYFNKLNSIHPVIPESEGLPEGWEAKRLQSGAVVYINHQQRVTTFDRPTGVEEHLDEVTPSAPTSEQLEPWSDQAAAFSLGASGNSENDEMPPGWTKKTTKDGRDFFLHHARRITTWVDPRTSVESPIPGPSQPSPGLDRQRSVTSLGPLPEGWEEKTLKNGKLFFVDHINKRTTWEDPRFDDSSIAGKKVEYSRDYKYKYEMLMREMRQFSGAEGDKFEFTIRRQHMVDDSFNAIGKAKLVHRLRHRLWITFAGEQGLDYGGLAREWFSQLTTQLFNPYYGLFEYSATDNYTLQINPNSGICNEDHLMWFKFIGRIAGMAVFHKKLINGFFIRPFYSMMLGKTIKLSDMESVDIEFSNSLCWIRDNDPECLALTFEVDDNVFGEHVSKELVPGGKDIEVTEENKIDYIDRMVQWRFVNRVQKQMKAFLGGFYDVIPSDSIKNFDEGELEMLLGGIGSINVKDWKEHTEYKKYTAEDTVIQWFWRLVLSFGDEMRSRLLQFVTGTSRVPMNGFKVDLDMTLEITI